MRSLRNRLAVVFGLIVLGAIGTVYLSVTPRLEDRLTEQKLDALLDDARRGEKDIAPIMGTNVNGEALARRVGDAASRSSAEVLVLGPVSGNAPGLSLAEDSQVNGGVRFDDVFDVALRAMRTRRAQPAPATTGGGRRAWAAEPLMRGKEIVGVAVFADALADVEANVSL